MHPQDTIPEAVDEPEEWRPVPGFEGIYSVSSFGRVRSERKRKSSYPGLILKPGRETNGRLFVNLRHDGHGVHARIHQLVARMFIGPVPPGKQINHIDGDHQNNRAENLEYVTEAENKAHAVRLGLVCHGERRPETHLTEADVTAIRTSNESRAVLAERYGMTAVSIGKIQRGDRWQRVGGPVSRMKPGKYPRPEPPAEMIHDIRNSTESSRVVAARYGISFRTVLDIRNGKRWSHIP